VRGVGRDPHSYRDKYCGASFDRSGRGGAGQEMDSPDQHHPVCARRCGLAAFLTARSHPLYLEITAASTAVALKVLSKATRRAAEVTDLIKESDPHFKWVRFLFLKKSGWNTIPTIGGIDRYPLGNEDR
jgi:hypothetical protein